MTDLLLFTLDAGVCTLPNCPPGILDPLGSSSPFYLLLKIIFPDD